MVAGEWAGRGSRRKPPERGGGAACSKGGEGWRREGVVGRHDHLMKMN